MVEVIAGTIRSRTLKMNKMHEWHTNTDKSIISLINEFEGFAFTTDYGNQEVKRVEVTNRVFPNYDDAREFVCNKSYGSEVAYLAASAKKVLSKGYQTAFNNFIIRYKEYLNFRNNLTIAYGRSASKATCPNCGSSINLNYGRRFRLCPVCGSKKIISDSNWKTLDTKRRMVERASVNLNKEAEKNEVTFICGIEWHC